MTCANNRRRRFPIQWAHHQSSLGRLFQCLFAATLRVSFTLLCPSLSNNPPYYPTILFQFFFTIFFSFLRRNLLIETTLGNQPFICYNPLTKTEPVERNSTWLSIIETISKKRFLKTSRIGFISSHLRYYIMKLTQYFLKLSTFIKTKTRTKPVDRNSIHFRVIRWLIFFKWWCSTAALNRNLHSALMKYIY